MRQALKSLFVLTLAFTPVSALAQSVANETIYSFGDGEPAFVLLQGMSYDATIKMDETAEVWTLNKSQGTRGSVVYRNDAGRVFLRVNHIGGATVYPTPNSMGIPVLRQSKYRIETKNPISQDGGEKLASVEEWSRAYAYAGNKVTNSTVLVDNVLNSEKIEFSDWPHSKMAYKTELISHLSELMENFVGQEVERIIVKIGEQPAVAQHNDDLTIWVNPTLGFAGRPSTEKILADMKLVDG